MAKTSLSSHFSSAGASHRTASEGTRIWLHAAVILALLPACLATGSCCSGNSIRKIPTIRGRVLEAKTGKPIAGARLARWFEREDGCLAPGGSDVHSVAGSFLAVITDKDGWFEWPAWTSLTSPILAMQWYIYRPGWVAEKGWFNHPRSGLEGYYFGVDGADPWVHVVSHPVGSHLEVTLTMEPTDNTAAWEAHFQRMVSLTQYGKLDVAFFVEDVTRYAEAHELTAGISDRIYEVQRSLGGLNEDGTFDRPQDALVLLGIQREYCKHHSQEPRCSPVYLNQRQTFLQHGLEVNQKTTQ